MVSWSATLVVEVDEELRLLTPRVRVQGRPGFARRTLRVELVDRWGVVRRVARRALEAESLGAEVRMPSFATPDGASVDEVVRWCWDVVVEEDGVELVRWRRYLEVSARLGPEGEIELAGPPGGLRSKEEVEGRGPEAPWDERDSERLLMALVDEGVLAPEERDEALAAHASTGKTVERALIDSGCLSEHEVLSRYADLTGCEFVDLARYPIDPKAAETIPEELERLYGLMAIGFRGDLLTVATSDPQNVAALRWVDEFAEGSVYIVVTTRDDVCFALEARGPLDTTPEPD
jgi:Type II secretion system (T2SS), protein E, N-terminal domain